MMPITNPMSVRECSIALDVMADTDAVCEALQAHRATVEGTPGAAAIDAAVHRLATLWTLACHQQCNLRSGAGVPPTPTAPRKVAPPSAEFVPKPYAAHGGAHAEAPVSTPPCAANRQGRAKTATPEGYVSSAEFMAALGIGLATFHEQRKLRSSGIPAPEIGGGPGRPAFWRKEVVAQAIAARKLKHLAPRASA